MKKNSPKYSDPEKKSHISQTFSPIFEYLFLLLLQILYVCFRPAGDQVYIFVLPSLSPLSPFSLWPTFATPSILLHSPI